MHEMVSNLTRIYISRENIRSQLLHRRIRAKNKKIMDRERCDGLQLCISYKVAQVKKTQKPQPMNHLSYPS